MLRVPRPPAASSLVGAVLAPVRGFQAAIRADGHGPIWVEDDRAHLPVLGGDRPGVDGRARRLEERLRAVEGVRSVAFNGVLGRVVVDFDPDQVTVAELVRSVAEEEADHAPDSSDGLAGQPPPELGGVGALAGPAVSLAADLGCLGAALALRALRVPPIPVAVPWVVSQVDVRLSASRVGRLRHPAVGLGVALSRALAMGLARGEVGLLTDAAYRLSMLTESRAWRASWAARERELSNASHRTQPIQREQRRCELPAGPIERSVRLAMVSALGAGGLVVGVARSPARVLGFLVAGTPTAANLGREAFAAQFGRTLAARGVVAIDPLALRRLDRVDTTIIDSSVVLTGRHRIDEVRILDEDPELDPAEIHRRAHELIDPARPMTYHSEDGWEVRPITGRGRQRGRTKLRLNRKGVSVAEVWLVPELDPLAQQLVDAAGRVGQVIVAGGAADLHRRLAADSAVPGGRRLVEAVREVQRNGHGVVVVSAAGDEALAAADCGVGVLSSAEPVPWGGHLLCGPGLSDACLLVDGVGAAHEASRRIGRISLVGVGAAVLFVLAGPAWGAGRRAMAAANAAALFSIAAGTWWAMALARRAEPVPRNDTDWHMLQASTALARVGSGHDGLDPEEADRRLATRPRPAGDEEGDGGLVRAALEELDNPLTPTLSVAAGVSAVSGAVVDAVLIGAVLGVNALLGGAQRVRADRAMSRLMSSSTIGVRLRRGGRVQHAEREDLVPGDVIEVQAGDAIPADCRLLEAVGLEVDESGLTGESLPVTKSPKPSVATALAERHSMLHEGTSVAAGRGTAVVVATGPETELGRTARAAAGAGRPAGVEARLQSLTRKAIPVCIGAGAALIVAGMVWRRPVYNNLATGISLAVAAVPEGLPFIATVAQLSAAGRLSQHQALVRQPATIEALGRVDVLCFDKTGTLTEGKIRLRLVSDGYTDEPVEALSAHTRRILGAALRASPQSGAERPLAHSTDRAVVEGAVECDVTASDGLEGWSPVGELPFEPARGYHAVLGRHATGHRIAVKGAPEVVMPRCSAWIRNGTSVTFDESAARDLAAAVDRLARRGYRVLAVAEREASDQARLVESRLTRLTFVGLVALADPIRGSAREAVKTLHAAGVDVAVVTGDHPSTAEAIAAELGLLDGRRIMIGPQLDQMDDQAVMAALPDVVVFARTTPTHKVRIVDLLRRSGRVVAVTGDGANDAPAIKMADVGIALGRNGTDAAKAAADVVITDDRIETITDAIVEGRALWVSVRDAVSVMLGGNFAEIAFTLGSGLFTRSGSALNARQLLLVNLLTDVLPAMAIAAQRPPHVRAESLLREGPDASLGGALNREIVVRAAATTTAAGLAYALGRASGTRAHAGTVALVALVGAQLGQTLFVGRRSPLVLSAGLASFAALAITVQTPGLSQFFGCRPLGPTGWAFSLLPALAATLAAALASRLLPPAHGRSPRSN